MVGWVVGGGWFVCLLVWDVVLIVFGCRFLFWFGLGLGCFIHVLAWPWPRVGVFVFVLVCAGLGPYSPDCFD